MGDKRSRGTVPFPLPRQTKGAKLPDLNKRGKPNDTADCPITQVPTVQDLAYAPMRAQPRPLSPHTSTPTGTARVLIPGPGRGCAVTDGGVLGYSAEVELSIEYNIIILYLYYFVFPLLAKVAAWFGYYLQVYQYKNNLIDSRYNRQRLEL